MAFRFIVTSVLSSTPIGELELSAVSWNDPVFGAGGSFSGQAEIGITQTRDNLAALTIPDQMALYVMDDATDQYMFGGPIFARPWDRVTRRLTIQAQSWKSWMYQKLCGMNKATNPVTDTTFAYTAQDQFTIAQSLITLTANADIGCPHFVIGTELSGVLRDLNFHGSDQRFLGDQIDSMANRDNGFEWTIVIDPTGTNGNPTLRFLPSFPTRGGLNNQVLLLHQQTTGGNILEMDNPEESAADRRSRVWATGAGQPPDQIVAYDEDPSIAGGFILLREGVTNYNSVTIMSTLAAHARAERIYRAQPLQQVTVSVAVSDPSYTTYAPGDKVRLLVEDGWVMWDFDAVRIIDRSFQINNTGEAAKPDVAKLLIDLNDIDPPETAAVV